MGRSNAMKLRRECGRAGVRSRDTEWIRLNAMKWMRVIKLRRELSPPMFVAVVSYRRHLIESSVGCASARKLFFSSARRGWGSERGRGLAVRAVILLLRRKNGILILGRG